MTRVHDHKGELFLLAVCLLEGFSPILLHRGSELFPPLFFLVVTAAIAASITAVILVASRRWPRRLPRRGLGAAAGVSFFIMGGYVFTLIGTRMTSGINTALLGQTEMFFTFVITVFFLKERWSNRQLLGAFIVVCGTMLVLYNGHSGLNRGDLFIVLATVFYPLGNLSAKRALQTLDPLEVLFLRYAFAIVLFLPISFFAGEFSQLSTVLHREAVLVLCIYGVMIFFLSKFLWYSGLKHLPLSRSFMIISANPVFSLLFAFLLLREVPTAFQILGAALAMTGVIILVKRTTVFRVD